MLRQIIRGASSVPHTRTHYALPTPNSRNVSCSPPKPAHAHLPNTRVVRFHSTPQRQVGPLLPIFTALLKSSASLEFTRMAGRIALTFMPVILLKNMKSSKKIRNAALRGIPTSEEKKGLVMKQIQRRKYVLYGLLFVPLSLFWATIIASLEKTPLTGRWRMIVLSPEEEEEIANQLAGSGWYSAVGEILGQDGPAKLVPQSDWRYQWVNETLRRLEATIPILANEPEIRSQSLAEDQNSLPMPPPAEYPLRSRPRASEYIHRVCESICDGKVVPTPIPHTIQGPPYSLVIVDKPEVSNAFSYGFGPDGGGGIVVYSGFLDDVLARTLMAVPTTPITDNRSWWSRLFGSTFSGPRPPPPRPMPTSEQTSELAILLAHELSHLVLSHHLETLSSTTVIIPGTISIITDLVRVVLFPITMLFGPFVNDALAQLGKVGSLELTKVGEYCTSMTQEIEADVVSIRLLAHAGFDAREAVKFWEVRSSTLSERAGTENKGSPYAVSETLVRRITGSTHPVNEIRVERLKNELGHWETVRQAIISRMLVPQGAYAF